MALLSTWAAAIAPDRLTAEGGLVQVPPQQLLRCSLLRSWAGTARTRPQGRLADGQPWLGGRLCMHAPATLQCTSYVSTTMSQLQDQTDCWAASKSLHRQSEAQVACQAAPQPRLHWSASFDRSDMDQGDESAPG